MNGKSLLAAKRSSIKENPFSSYGNDGPPPKVSCISEDIDFCLNYSNMGFKDEDIKKLAT